MKPSDQTREKLRWEESLYNEYSTWDISKSRKAFPAGNETFQIMPAISLLQTYHYQYFYRTGPIRR